MTLRRAFAPAKVNLYLHVGPVAADGFHPLCSLAVFADIGDDLTAEPAQAFDYRAYGEGAESLGGDDDLVVRAVDALVTETGGGRPYLRLRLRKVLPLASGLGGGTADGAAALRLLGAHLDPETLARAAATLGADGPVCLAARPVLMRGRGERLTPVEGLPGLPAVLVNPGVACPTAEVYRAYDAGPVRSADRRDPPTGSPSDIAAWLASETRNDLEAPAIAIQPAVGQVLAILGARPETRLARMSGSGATCFALTRDAEDAHKMAARLAAEQPDWWVRACRLGDMRDLATPSVG